MTVGLQQYFICSPQLKIHPFIFHAIFHTPAASWAPLSDAPQPNSGAALLSSWQKDQSICFFTQCRRMLVCKLEVISPLTFLIALSHSTRLMSCSRGECDLFHNQPSINRHRRTPGTRRLCLFSVSCVYVFGHSRLCGSLKLVLIPQWLNTLSVLSKIRLTSFFFLI